MPNAEGRMEDDVQAALDLFSKSVAFGLLRPYPPEEAAWRTIHAALAAARAENEKLREALAHYANAVNWMSHTDADAMLRVWIGSGGGPDYARRALAAQEGTR